jgi:Calx-beta domain
VWRRAVIVFAIGFVVGTLAFQRGRPAGAASVALDLTCQSATPIGTIATTQVIGFEATAPTATQPQHTLPIDLVFPPTTVSSSQNGGAARVDYIKELSYRIDVPANSQYVSGSISGGFNYGAGTPSVSLQGSPTAGSIRYLVPGPIATDEEFQIPALQLTVRAIGEEGSTIRTQLGGTSVANPGFTTTAHVTSPFSGDAATSCFEPAPKTVWTTTTIVFEDLAPPTITLNAPANSAQYPQGATVVVSYSCADGQFGSGVATCLGDLPSGSILNTSVLGTFSFTVQSSDHSGNVAAPRIHTYEVVAGGDDEIPPSVDVVVPADGLVVSQGATLIADYACSDVGSGVATCDGDVDDGAVLDTATVGPHTFTVTATDFQGLPHAETRSYQVLPSPTQQNFASGDLANQIPVACDNQFQTAHKSIPVAGNSAPIATAQNQQFSWTVHLGSDFVPSLSNGTNLLYEFAPPENARFVDVVLIGPGAQVSGSTVAISDGYVQLRIASVTDQSTAGIGNDNFTPPPFRATMAVEGAAGTEVITRLARFEVTTAPAGLPLPTTSRCTGGDPTFNGRSNPVLSRTAVLDTTPPEVVIASPAHGLLIDANDSLQFVFACSDDHRLALCAGSEQNGATLDTSSSGPRQVAVFSSDAAGNANVAYSTYIVSNPTVDVADAETVEGPTAFLTFDVTISNPAERTISVAYTTSDRTAIADTDYVSTSGVLTFVRGGPMEQAILVPVVDDSTFGPNRDLALHIVSATNARVGRNEAVGTIVDDDPPPVTVGSPRASESAGQLGFELTLAANPNFPVTVDYVTVDDTAQSPGRYASTEGSVVFAPGGELSRTVAVPIVNDATYNESSPFNRQSFVLRAVQPANGYTAEGTGTIIDDDPSPTFVSIGSASIREGDGSTRVVNLSVTLSKPSSQTVTVGYRVVTGTASLADLRNTVGITTFNPGQVYKNVSVRVVGDLLDESDEAFVMRLTNATNAQLWNTDGIVTIVDDDPAASSVQMEVSDAQLVESSDRRTSTLKFTVTLNRPSGATVSVRYSTVPGSASTADYRPKTNVIEFTGSQVSKVVSIVIVNDSLPEADETFSVVLSGLSGPVSITKGAGIGTIVNDD